MSQLHLSSPSESWQLIGHQKVADSIPVWGSEIVFLRIELDERSSIILTYNSLLLKFISKNLA